MERLIAEITNENIIQLMVMDLEHQALEGNNCSGKLYYFKSPFAFV
jgi:hypothetical protein